MKRFFLTANLYLIITFTMAQGFWSTTGSFPGGPKTAVALARDTCLLVGLTDGIVRSFDEGNSFEHILAAPAIFTVFANSEGKVFAGGAGMIYISNDLGASWDSISTNSTYPVTQFVGNQQGDIFAATGMLSYELGYVGDGILCSEDGGLTWAQRNNGLGIYKCCERIAIDSHDRLYVAMADEYVTGNGGLFISDDAGGNWEHIPIFIDGQGVVDDHVKIANTYGLAVSPDDSVYFSFAGVAVNVLVTVNTRKSIFDIRDNSYWKIHSVFNSISWWLDRTLSSIFFASDGTWYASARGSLQSGGTYYSVDKGLSWKFTVEGLGATVMGTRLFQHFTESNSGKVYMVHTMDERVYFTENDPFSVFQPGTPPVSYRLVPNPVRAGMVISISRNDPSGITTFTIYDISGRKVSSYTMTGQHASLEAPDKKGLYIIESHSPSGRGIYKLIVND
jgi:photosystem II stability/assembly factor-like uncharacterized protein